MSREQIRSHLIEILVGVAILLLGCVLNVLVDMKVNLATFCERIESQEKRITRLEDKVDIDLQKISKIL